MPAPKPLPPLAELREIITYDPDTGLFLNAKMRSSTALAGAATGTLNKHTGYIVIRHNKSLYLAHRLAWLFLTGDDPGAFDVDHINGVPRDNRAANLRLATRRQNLCNSKTPCTNTSGHKGVYRNRGRWVAYSRTEKGRLHIGTFVDKQDAIRAYRNTVPEIHGQFVRF